ncbi:zinc finger MYM-type protein 5-like [Melanaphis sacchari]|nr:zinc finger MYM-type protein 5-like [Melanaphis sacchari]
MNLQKYLNSSLSESNEFHSSPSTSASIGFNSENTQIESDKISNNQCDSIAITSNFVLNNINKTIIPDTANNDINKESHLVQNSPVTIDNNIYDHDPALWPKVISSKLKDLIISYGPRQVFLKQYPKDDKDRHFSSIHYSRTLPNNELIPRRWLIYSESSDRVYCFCCLCFHQGSRSSLANTGFNDWIHLSSTLKSHETCSNHILSYTKWIETELRLKSGKSIDHLEQLLIQKESERWNQVLTRLMNIALYLAENNIAFRGVSDKLYSPNNGKYLGLIQLFAKFDPIMQRYSNCASRLPGASRELSKGAASYN